MSTVKNDFSTGDVRRHIINMAIPTIFAQLVNVLYSVVDRIFIGHIPSAGTLALTGVGVAVPIISAISAFTALCGSGGAPLCSIERGKGNLDKAEQIMGNAFSMLLIFGAVLTLGCQCFLRPILYTFGASDLTFPYAQAYARIYVWGTFFVMISLGMNYFINSQGFARIGMLTVAIGAVLNIILDALFILVFHLGVAGAAYATIFAQFCSAAWALSFLCSRRAILRLRLKRMKLSGEVVGKILGLGITGFSAKVTNSIVLICNNAQLLRYGGDLYVGAMTVIYSVREVVMMISLGFTGASQPVLGYNYGAGREDRVKQAIRFMTRFILMYSIGCWMLLMLATKPIVSVFTSDADLIGVCIPSLRCFFCGFLFLGLQATGQSIFVGLGMAKRATFFSLLRKVVIVVPLVYLLPLVFGVTGVYFSEPVSDLLGGGACYLTMYLTVYRKLKSEPILAAEHE